jgi:hypothetical protein
VYANDDKSGIYPAKVQLRSVSSSAEPELLGLDIDSPSLPSVCCWTAAPADENACHGTLPRACAQVLRAAFNRKGFPDSWSYFVHFLGWKKSHDKWVSDAHIVWRDESVRTAASTCCSELLERQRILCRHCHCHCHCFRFHVSVALRCVALRCVALRCLGAVRACVRRACGRASAGICEGWENIGDHDLG